MAKFQIFIDKAKPSEYRFRLRATGNNEIILVSEGYEQKSGCQNGIESVKKHSTDKDNFRLWKRKEEGPYWFTLLAQNEKIIGTSEMYTTRTAREEGVELVKTQAKNATTEDLTI